MPEYVVGRMTTLVEEVWVQADSPEEAVRTAIAIGAFAGHGRETVHHHAFPASEAKVIPFPDPRKRATPRARSGRR